MASKLYPYFKSYPITAIAFIIYIILWVSLFTPFAIVIGEWPVAPLFSLPFLALLLLNVIFNKKSRKVYAFVMGISLLPILIICFVAAYNC